jgi:hypothetical protein
MGFNRKVPPLTDNLLSSNRFLSETSMKINALNQINLTFWSQYL